MFISNQYSFPKEKKHKNTVFYKSLLNRNEKKRSSYVKKHNNKKSI